MFHTPCSLQVSPSNLESWPHRLPGLRVLQTHSKKCPIDNLLYLNFPQFIIFTKENRRGWKIRTTEDIHSLMNMIFSNIYHDLELVKNLQQLQFICKTNESCRFHYSKQLGLTMLILLIWWLPQTPNVSHNPLNKNDYASNITRSF